MATYIGVELAEVGVWEASTGPVDITSERLYSMAAAVDDPTIGRPRVVIGHDGVDDAERPAYGRVVNLRVTADGLTLLGDLVDVPDDITPQSYPLRSIEGLLDCTSAAGHNWPAVLTAVALLGSSAPAIGALAEMPAAVGGGRVAASHAMRASIAGRVISSRAMPPATMSVSAETLRDRYYASLSDADRAQHWVREVLVEPQSIVVETGEGLVALTYAIGSDESVTWGEPAPVTVSYVPLPAGQEDQLPEPVAASSGVTPTVFSRAASAPPPPSPGPAPPPPGTVIVDEGTLMALQRGAADGVEARRMLAAQARDAAIHEAVSTGRIPPARTQHWSALWDADPEGTARVLASLAPGVIAMQPAGYAGTGVPSGDGLTDWDRETFGLPKETT